MRLTGGPSFVFYRSQGEEILQLISSWKRPHYRPTSNTSHCQSVNIDFFLILLYKYKFEIHVTVANPPIL